MGGGTKTVGGGSATGVANDFNSVMRQGLNNGSYGATGQTQGFGATIDAMLKGRQGDPTGLNDYQTTLKQMQSAGRYTPDTINGLGSANPLDDPNHPFNQLMSQFQNQNLGKGLGSQANLGGPFQAASGDINGIMSQIGSQANLGSLSGYTGNLNNAAGQLGNSASQQYFQRTPTDINSPYGAAVQQLLQQQDQRNVADLRARYAITGGSQGTPAGQAEALYRSQSIPQMTAALSDINQKEQGLNLQQAGINSQYSLGQSGQALQALLGAGGIATQGREQDLSNQLGNRNADIGASNTSVANASQMNQANLGARGQDLQNFLSSRGLDLNQLGLMNSSLLGQAGLGLQAGQSGMQNNQFNSNQNFNAQSQNAQNGLSAQNLYQQMLGQTGNLALQGGALNLQNANSNTQNIQQMLQMLMGGYQQANQLGTPQAQTVQTPSFLSQLGSAAGGLGGLFGSLSGMGANFGNIFGGGGGNMQMPQFGGLPPFQQTTGNGIPIGMFNGQIHQPPPPGNYTPYLNTPTMYGR